MNIDMSTVVHQTIIKLLEQLRSDHTIESDIPYGIVQRGDWTTFPGFRCLLDGHISRWPVEVEELDALERCVQSRHMASVWRAVNKRANLTPPVRFADAVINAHKAKREPPHGPKSQCDALRKLASHLDTVAAQIAPIAPIMGFKDEWCGPHRVAERSTGADHPVFKSFSTTPVIALKHLSDWLSQEADRLWSNSYPGWTSQPGRKTSPRQVFVRRLSASMQDLYGQYLDEVVACTASVVLDDDVDASYVRDARTKGKGPDLSARSGIRPP